MKLGDLRIEKPLYRTPVSLLIDDLTPCINPAYYFALQVPHDALWYVYRSKNGNRYFTEDKNFTSPIKKEIAPDFIRKFASWCRTEDLKGKISLIPYPAGLGRIDKTIEGFPRRQVQDFVSVVKNQLAEKFDVCPEMLTHTNALDLKTKKLRSESEHDWSQNKKSKVLTPYITFGLEILKNAGLEPSGITSPINFGMYSEADYVKSILDACKSVLGRKVVWYFLREDPDSLNLSPRLMYFDRTNAECVVSIVVCASDIFWASQYTEKSMETYIHDSVGSLISKDGTEGRIADLIANDSWIFLVTHWQSLYSNGSYIGFEGLKELVSRLNSLVREKITWMKCSDVAEYTAATNAALLRTIVADGALRIEASGPIDCKNFTFSFESTDHLSSIIKEGRKLFRAPTREKLQSDSWYFDATRNRTIICLGNLGSSGWTIPKDDPSSRFGISLRVS